MSGGTNSGGTTSRGAKDTTAPTKGEPAKGSGTKADPAKGGPAKGGPAKTGPAKGGPAKSSGAKGPGGKNAKRSQGARRAQEIAAQRMAQARAAERRRRALLVGGVALAVLLIAGLVGYGVYKDQQVPSSAQVTSPVAAAGGTGITIGDAGAKANADIYLDFLCPNCKSLEDMLGATIDDLVKAGTLKVTYRPVAILDDASSGTRYSTRAAAAAGCASDAGVLPQYMAQLWANQPAEGGPGLTDDTLIELGTTAGITGTAADTFSTCVKNEKYADWATANTDQFSRDGLRGTPTVKINGKTLTGNDLSPENFAAAVNAA